MSDPFVSGLVDDLHDRLILLIDYSAHARRLSLRIETKGRDEPGGPQTTTLLFDGVVGLHCDPPNALAPIDQHRGGEILRFDGKRRKTGEYEFILVFIRDGAGERETQVASFLAQAARRLA
jgi:hypothetical protein